MFGNLVTNKQLNDLMKYKIVEIKPFKSENMSLAHYTLHVNKIYRKLPNGSIQLVHDFNKTQKAYELAPNEYVVIEIEEQIRFFEENIVGHFVPASNLIEDGIGLTAGKIDKKYGSESGKNIERIRFGVKNLTEYSFQLPFNYRIAHLVLFDFRGVALEKIELTDEEKRIRIQRLFREFDDGPDYHSDDEK